MKKLMQHEEHGRMWVFDRAEYNSAVEAEYKEVNPSVLQKEAAEKQAKLRGEATLTLKK